MSTASKQLYRSRHERMIAGVCGGLGDYLNIDPTIIRLIFVFGAFATGSALFWAYIIMMVIVPEEPLASDAVVESTGDDLPVEETE
jgi:phage shock protein C